MQAKGITGVLNGVEDIVKPDNEDLGLEVRYNASSLEKKLEIKAAYQEAQVPYHPYPCPDFPHLSSPPPPPPRPTSGRPPLQPHPRGGGGGRLPLSLARARADPA